MQSTNHQGIMVYFDKDEGKISETGNSQNVMKQVSVGLLQM